MCFGKLILPAALLYSCLVPALARAQVDIMIGDNDGYGFGAALAPDNGTLPFTTAPFSVQDNRSPAEAAATDGSEQTDLYSALSFPVSQTFNLTFLLPSPITSGTLTIDMGGFQPASFDQVAVSYNGVLQPNLLNFDDGPNGSAVRAFALNAIAIANANAANNFIVHFDRSNSTDAFSFDYFRFQATTTAVPEPGSLTLLLGMGVVGAGFLRRRRQFAPKAL